MKKVEPESKGIPAFKVISLYNISVKGAKRANNANGLENLYMENVLLKAVSRGRNCIVNFLQQGLEAQECYDKYAGQH